TGLLQALRSEAGSDVLTLQEIDYGTEWTISAIRIPGHGSTSFEYDPGLPLLRKVVEPDGVVTEVVSRDALTDAILTLRSDRVARSFDRFYRYDGLERLAAHWDSLGGGAEDMPAQQLLYREADAIRPAMVELTSLADASGGVYRKRLEFLST